MKLPPELVEAFLIFPDVGNRDDVLERASISAARLCRLPRDCRVSVLAAIRQLLDLYSADGWPDEAIQEIVDSSNVLWEGPDAADLRDALVEMAECLELTEARDAGDDPDSVATDERNS